MLEKVANLHPNHPEYCPPEEVEEQTELASFELRRKFFEDCSLLRADFVSLLAEHNALFNKGGWALFLVEDIDGQSELATIQGRNEVLVIIGTGNEVHSGEFDVADIRVVTNHLLNVIDGEFQFVTRDFTLDENNLCQYMAGSFTLDEKGKARAARYVPLFYPVGKNRFKSYNIHPLTQAYGVAELVNNVETAQALPFGHYSYVEDAIYALQSGREIYNLIKDAEPYSSGKRHWSRLAP